MLRKWLLAAAVALGGCDSVQQETYSSGGFITQSYFDHLFPAVTHQQRFDRYLLTVSVLAPLTLETAGDAQQAAAAINRVNATYGSLHALLKAAESCKIGEDCASVEITAGEPTAYAFEAAAYEVQSDLYFLSKELIVNLDLSESVQNIAQLDVSGLLAISKRFTELFPIARRGAATYRDGVILLADTVRASCSDHESKLTTEGQKACNTLKTQITGRYGAGSDLGGAFDIKTLLNAAKSAADRHPWRMSPSQRKAAIYHIDRACARAFDFQKIDNDETDSYVNCGTATQGEGIVAKKRELLWTALK